MPDEQHEAEQETGASALSPTPVGGRHPTLVIISLLIQCAASLALVCAKAGIGAEEIKDQIKLLSEHVCSELLGPEEKE